MCDVYLGTHRYMVDEELYSGDQIKKHKIGRTCNTYGRKEVYIQGLGQET